MTEKALDKEFSKLIKNIQKKTNIPEYNTNTCELKQTFPDFSSPLLNQPTDNLCKVDGLSYQCDISNLDSYYKIVNSSTNIMKTIPKQLNDKNYDNIYVNKTFPTNSRVCKSKTSNAFFNLDDDTANPNMSIDSEGYCVLKNAYIN